nr:hypothetical protein [Tanacetum cinerariifolium]
MIQLSGGYNVVPLPITGNFMPPKPDLPVEAPILAATPKPTSPKTNCSSKRKNRKTCFVCRSVDHLIKDYNFHAKPDSIHTKELLLTKSKPVSVTAVRPVSVVVPKIMTLSCLMKVKCYLEYLEKTAEAVNTACYVQNRVLVTKRYNKTPFFRAFQVTADVPEIYMQEFWATAKLHHNSIRFKMETKKSVLDLEAFREMLHISPR